jgi:hypothetical protein
VAVEPSKPGTLPAPEAVVEFCTPTKRTRPSVETPPRPGLDHPEPDTPQCRREALARGASPDPPDPSREALLLSPVGSLDCWDSWSAEERLAVLAECASRSTTPPRWVWPGLD